MNLTAPEGDNGKIQILRTTYKIEKEEAETAIGMLLVIRPWTKLIGCSSDHEIVIPVDDLEEGERGMYLEDFLPTNPAI